jgi:hypothetical protein
MPFFDNSHDLGCNEKFKSKAIDRSQEGVTPLLVSFDFASIEKNSFSSFSEDELFIPKLMFPVNIVEHSKKSGRK